MRKTESKERTEQGSLIVSVWKSPEGRYDVACQSLKEFNLHLEVGSRIGAEVVAGYTHIRPDDVDIYVGGILDYLKSRNSNEPLTKDELNRNVDFTRRNR